MPYFFYYLFRNSYFFTFLLILSSQFLFAQRITDSHEIQLENLTVVENEAVRVSIDQSSGRLFYSTVSGDIYEVAGWKTGSVKVNQLASVADHGLLTQTAGMLAYKGYIYLLGHNDFDEDGKLLADPNQGQGAISTEANLMKAKIDGKNLGDWEVVAKTEKYGSSRSAFDHRMNALAIDPLGEYIYINSGSRTDHGEVQSNKGKYPDTREVPLTSKILRIPIDSKDLELPATEEELTPYVFCNGIRNSFGLAFDFQGYLFGSENSGDRDHPEELNWLREGHHYGFPWDLGGVPNPQQFPNYDPGEPNGKWNDTNKSNDPFIQGGKTIAWHNGYFHNDPDYPKAPSADSLTLPIKNLGPHADQYRDTVDFLIKDGSDEGVPVYSLSPHLSPTGMAFEKAGLMGKGFSYNGFLVNFNRSGLLDVFNKDRAGGSLLDLSFVYDEETDNYSVNTQIIAEGFNVPIDVAIYQNNLFVIEYNKNNLGSIWKLTFPEKDDAELISAKTDVVPVIDGIGDDSIWTNVPWHGIDYLWVDEVSGNENTFPEKEDLSGKFKVTWGENKLYFLVEIEDEDLRYSAYDPNGKPNQVFGEDALEIFIDEDASGGDHTKSHNAFAYHFSPNGNVADQCGCGDSGDWDGRLYNNNVEYKWTEKDGKYIWEVAMSVYTDQFDEDKSIEENKNALADLIAGKTLGIGVAYNDYDGTDGKREHLLGSFLIEGDNNGAKDKEGGRNIAWQDAGAYTKLTLSSQKSLCPAEPYFAYPENTINLEEEFGEFKLELSSGEFDGNAKFSIEPGGNNLVDVQIDEITGELSLTEIQGKTGIETLYVKAENTCGHQYVKAITVNLGVLSSKEEYLKSQVTIFPNPASQNVFVALGGNQKADIVRLTDLSGKIILSKSELKNNLIELDLSNVPSGVYIIQANIQGTRIFKKLVKVN